MYADALKAAPDAKQNPNTVAAQGLAYCNQFFAIEKDLIEATPEERLKVRAEQSCAVLVRGYANKDLKSYAEEFNKASNCLQSESMGKADGVHE